MGGRLIPAYVSQAAWGAFAAWRQGDELALGDAMTELAEALSRDPLTLLDAPSDLLDDYLAAPGDAA